jgi:hypothetical protein
MVISKLLVQALLGGTANGQNGTESGNGGAGGLAVGHGAVANGANGQKGGLAIGVGSNANGGDIALDGGNTNGIVGGIALNGGQVHTSCNVAIGSHCFNVPGR